MVEMSQQVVDNLDKVIASLEDDGLDHQDAADAS